MVPAKLSNTSVGCIINQCNLRSGAIQLDGQVTLGEASCDNTSLAWYGALLGSKLIMQTFFKTTSNCNSCGMINC